MSPRWSSLLAVTTSIDSFVEHHHTTQLSFGFISEFNLRRKGQNFPSSFFSVCLDRSTEVSLWIERWLRQGQRRSVEENQQLLPRPLLLNQHLILLLHESYTERARRRTVQIYRSGSRIGLSPCSSWWPCAFSLSLYSSSSVLILIRAHLRPVMLLPRKE